MKRIPLIGTIAAAALTASLALAQQAEVNSIRGTQPDVAVDLERVYHQQTNRFTRNYRMQPPLIPHTIDKYQIDVKANECLGCHEWKNASDRGAPTLSMTHYLDRNGAQLDTVASRRWFCNQCHVPQMDAPDLVENTFQPSH